MKHDAFIADDQPVVRLGLRTLLADCTDLAFAGEAGDAHAALAMMLAHEYHLLVLELSLPGRSGLELIKRFKAERPRLPVLVFTDQPEEMYAVRAIRAGASGYLMKRSEPAIVLEAMRRVANGSMWINQKVAELLATDPVRNGDHLPHTRLTDREYGIFSRIVSGAKLTQIADELSLSIKTVSTHKSNILDKMTLSGQVDLVRYAIEHQLLGSDRG
ncbi:response regulator [Caenimonas koreensis]|uniref:response regulator n=1 Tax=Caenimonas koreensis TaxID=367474 RepID=UPI0037838029